SSSPDTSGRRVRSAAMPTSTVVAISTPTRTTVVTPCPRTRNVTAVAQPSPARTKNCQGWSPSALSCLLVKVAEFIVDPFADVGVERRRLFVLLRAVVMRPLHRREPDRHDARRAEDVRQEPRHAIEAAIDRRLQELLAAVDADERLDDLIVGLPLVDLRAQLIAHLLRLAARARRQRLVRAAAARAPHLAAQLILERVL